MACAKFFLPLFFHAYGQFHLILASLLVYLLVRLGQDLTLLFQIGRQLCLVLLGKIFGLLCLSAAA